ncbi:hypothetical protein [Aliiroseovarius crassostreae]|nr:hypothetical protein [Aliiroseovarius crassostreae]
MSVIAFPPRVAVRPVTEGFVARQATTAEAHDRLAFFRLTGCGFQAAETLGHKGPLSRASILG